MHPTQEDLNTATILTDIQGESDHNTCTVGEFQILLSKEKKSLEAS